MRRFAAESGGGIGVARDQSPSWDPTAALSTDIENGHIWRRDWASKTDTPVGPEPGLSPTPRLRAC